MRSDPIFGLELKSLIRERKIQVMPRTITIENNQILFSDGNEVQVQNIIWATGFQPDYSWIQINDAFNSSGNPIHSQGVSSVSGLFFLGIPWQSRRSSSLIAGVDRDAQSLSEKLNFN